MKRLISQLHHLYGPQQDVLVSPEVAFVCKISTNLNNVW